MPIYEYECPKCKKTIELLRLSESDTAPLCNSESCGPIEMNKVISLGTFHLKGQGWYKDGYSSKK